MVDTNGKDTWLRNLDAREVFPLSTEFLGLARYQANTQHQLGSMNDYIYTLFITIRLHTVSLVSQTIPLQKEHLDFQSYQAGQAP